MNAEERDFEKRKNNIIQRLMHGIFEDACADYLQNGDWENVPELDEWLDEKLREHDEVCKTVREYYDAKMYE